MDIHVFTEITDHFRFIVWKRDPIQENGVNPKMWCFTTPCTHLSHSAARNSSKDGMINSYGEQRVRKIAVDTSTKFLKLVRQHRKCVTLQRNLDSALKCCITVLKISERLSWFNETYQTVCSSYIQCNYQHAPFFHKKFSKLESNYSMIRFVFSRDI